MAGLLNEQTRRSGAARGVLRLNIVSDQFLGPALVHTFAGSVVGNLHM